VNVLLQTITEGQDVIAGKVFEYLSAQRPILAVVDPDGGDAWLLGRIGVGSVVSFREPNAVAAELRRYWQLWRRGALHDERIDTGEYQWPSLAERLGEVLRQSAALRH
jgi:hypothetical protein